MVASQTVVTSRVARDDRRPLINYIFALALILFMTSAQTACRLLEKRTARYCFGVFVDDGKRGVKKALKHIELCSRSAPFTWEMGGSKETYTCPDCQTRHDSYVTIDDLPLQFKVNSVEFTLTETGLKGGGKDWSLAGSPTLTIDIDKLH